MAGWLVQLLLALALAVSLPVGGYLAASEHPHPPRPTPAASPTPNLGVCYPVLGGYPGEIHCAVPQK